MQPFIYCKVTLHVSGVTAIVNESCGIHSTRLAHTSPDQAMLEGSSRTNIIPEVTVRVFSTPDDGCCDTRNM